MPKTKIVASYGPASSDPKTLKSLVAAGVSVFRINTSFPSVSDVEKEVKQLRTLLPETAILIDLQGYKVRIKDLPAPITLKKHQTVFLTAEAQPKPKDIDWQLVVDYAPLIKALHPDAQVLIDEGKIILRVVKKQGKGIRCVVEQEGKVHNKKTVNVPKVILDFPALSDKDHAMLKLAVKHTVEYVALSFVRSKKDIFEAKKILGNSPVKIISKIENSQGVTHFEEILEHSDGIMVARGDLGVETAFEQVPVLQKSFIKLARQQGKPIIIATHMLESMITSPVPTRAEVSDIANAVFDGTDALMLSGETAIGSFPVNAVKAMARIALNIEKEDFNRSTREQHVIGTPVLNAVAKSVMHIGRELEVKAILVATESGTTARAIASFRPEQEVYAFTTSPLVDRQLNLLFGVEAFQFKNSYKNRDEMVKDMLAIAVARKLLKRGDLAIVVSGNNIMHQGQTNMIEVRVV